MPLVTIDGKALRAADVYALPSCSVPACQWYPSPGLSLPRKTQNTNTV
jgi:hypothetical protein